MAMKTFRKQTGSQVVFNIPLDSPCPCGSDRGVGVCCLTSQGLRKPSASTVPPGPLTEFALPKCYAGPLNNCSEKLTREHFVSESLLEHLNKQNRLTVKGFAWQKEGEETQLRPNALATRVLCGRHNSALSRLDFNALRFFQAFDDTEMPPDGQVLYLFNGHDLERWLLKILCGLMDSRNISTSDGLRREIPRHWLDILFGNSKFLTLQGLYVCKEPGFAFEGPTGLSICLIERGRDVSGIGVSICGIELVLSMTGFPTRRFDGRSVAYRPLEFHTSTRAFEKSVIFSWDDDADLGTLELRNPNTTRL